LGLYLIQWLLAVVPLQWLSFAVPVAVVQSTPVAVVRSTLVVAVVPVAWWLSFQQLLGGCRSSGSSAVDRLQWLSFQWLQWLQWLLFD